MKYEQQKSRRDFIKAVTGTLCAGGVSSFIPQLDLFGSALAAQAKGLPGYKALVCVYLAGGSDSFNMLMPHDSTIVGSKYDIYRNSRGGVYNAGSNAQGLAIDFANMRSIDPIGQAAGSFGLHPSCADYNWGANPNPGVPTPGLQTLFQQNRLAFVANMGSLVEPLNKTEYNNRTKLRPPQLYSHSDQELQWQLSYTDANTKQGWGGRALDSIGLAATPLPACISIAGSNRFQVGNTVFPYQMNTGGASSISNYSTTSSSNAQNARRAALDQLLAISGQPVFNEEYRSLLRRSLDLATLVNDKLANFGVINQPYQISNGSAQLTLNGTNYSNSLLDQLRVVARMIKASRDPASGLNQSRQIYYVRLGGFDTHDTQMANAGQPLLMARISQALGWFWQALNEINAHNDVVTFSMSEFGRTLKSNVNGSDHAWGGNQFVMGGPVIGKTIYGKYPTLAPNLDDNVNQNWSFGSGQFIPTTSVDQYASTLARWLGVDNAALNALFPNLDNFSPQTLNFL